MLTIDWILDGQIFMVNELPHKMKKLVVAVLASGQGTHAYELWKHFHQEESVQFIFITDQKNAPVRERMEKEGVIVHLIESSQREKKVFEQELAQFLTIHQVEWIFLAGFMKILSGPFLQQFWDESLNRFKVVNIHPSLLPLFPGKDVYQRVYQAGVKISGCTLHFVDEGIDTGPIIQQKFFPRFDEDSLSDFMQRGKEVEYQVYREFMQALIKK